MDPDGGGADPGGIPVILVEGLLGGGVGDESGGLVMLGDVGPAPPGTTLAGSPLPVGGATSDDGDARPIFFLRRLSFRISRRPILADLKESVTGNNRPPHTECRPEIYLRGAKGGDQGGISFFYVGKEGGGGGTKIKEGGRSLFCLYPLNEPCHVFHTTLDHCFQSYMLF